MSDDTLDDLDAMIEADEEAGAHCRSQHAPHVREAIEAAAASVLAVALLGDALTVPIRPLPERETIVLHRDGRREVAMLPATTQEEATAARLAAADRAIEATKRAVFAAGHAMPRGVR